MSLFIYGIILKLTDHKSIALTGAILSSLFPEFVAWSSYIHTDQLFIFFLTGFIFFSLLFENSKKVLLYGTLTLIFFLLTYFTRRVFFGVIPIIFGYWIFMYWKSKNLKFLLIIIILISILSGYHVINKNSLPFQTTDLLNSNFYTKQQNYNNQYTKDIDFLPLIFINRFMIFINIQRVDNKTLLMSYLIIAPLYIFVIHSLMRYNYLLINKNFASYLCCLFMGFVMIHSLTFTDPQSRYKLPIYPILIILSSPAIFKSIKDIPSNIKSLISSSEQQTESL